MAHIVWPPDPVEGDISTHKMLNKGRRVSFVVGKSTFSLYGYAVRVTDTPDSGDGSLIYVPNITPEEL